MKKGFRNYNLELDKNERRIISSFCKQTLRQISGNSKFAPIERLFEGINEKVTSGEDVIKFTKEEYVRLEESLRETIRQITKSLDKSWFLKRWISKMAMSQYQSILDKYFKE